MAKMKAGYKRQMPPKGRMQTKKHGHLRRPKRPTPAGSAGGY